MKKTIAIFLWLALATSAHAAGNIRINLSLPVDGLKGATEAVLVWNTTAQEEAAISAAVAANNAQIEAQNAERAKQTPPAAPLPLLTPNTYVQSLIKPVFDAWVKSERKNKKESNIEAIGDQLTDLTAGQLKQVMDLLATFK